MSGQHVEEVARGLALKAGVLWSDLNDYPGFNKNRWREQARDLLSASRHWDRPRH